MTNVDDDDLEIESTRGPDDEPACLVTWGPFQWYSQVDEVRKTALDMMTCAAYAEMTMLMVMSLGIDAKTATGFITHLLTSTGREQFGSEDTVDLLPAGSTKTGEAVVLLRRGSKRGSVLAAAARTMAMQWFETAEATESDQLLSETLRANGMNNAVQENVFAYLRQLRNKT
jgi:hypothetical protein